MIVTAMSLSSKFTGVGVSSAYPRIMIREANDHLQEVYKHLHQIQFELDWERKRSQKLDDELTRLRQANDELERTRDELGILVASLENRGKEAKRTSEFKLERVANELRKLADSIICTTKRENDDRDEKNVTGMTNDACLP